MTAPTTDLPTVADFLTDATARLDRLTTFLAPRLGMSAEDAEIETRMAVRELTRILAQLAAAVRALAESEAHR